MSDTPNLKLPYIEAAQAQKHVTHNEALRTLDAVVQLGVLDRDLSAPPANPAEGDRYLVAAGASGDWSGKENLIAVFQDGGWAFLEPRPGWLCWVVDEDALTVWDGAAWNDVDVAVPDALQNKSMIGVNTSADATNRLSVKSEAVLFSHDGADVRVKVNKNAATDTASFLFQSGWSGRAEIGLCGDDDFTFKVSPDGSTWKTALTLDAASGLPKLPGFDKNDLPANASFGCVALAWNTSDGTVLVYHDGSDWRKSTDGQVV